VAKKPTTKHTTQGHLGVESSDLRPIIPLLIFYILANRLKGWITLHANESYRTQLNNPGHPRVDRPYSSREKVGFVGEKQDPERKTKEDVDELPSGKMAFKKIHIQVQQLPKRPHRFRMLS
jgi:hypothetical protein